MGIRLDLGEFVANLGQIGAAGIAGRIAGQQQREQRDLQEYQVMQQAVSQEAERQSALDRTLLGLRLTPESQAILAGGIASRPGPTVPLAETAYARAHPALQQVLRRGQPAPAASPALTATGPGFASPYGRLELTGVDPREAGRVMSGIDAALRDMRNITVTDPRGAAYRDELFRQRAALGPLDSPEALQAANTLYQNVLGFQSQVGGPTAQARQAAELRGDVTEFEQEFEKGNAQLDDLTFASTLPGWLNRERSIQQRYGGRGYGGKGLETHAKEIAEVERMLAAGDTEGAARLGREIRGRVASRVTPQQEQRAQTSVLQMIGKLSPRAVTPDVVRQLYTNAGIGYLVEGLPDDALRLGGSALEKSWEKNFALLSNPKRWAGLPQDARRAVLDEITGAAAQTGRKIDLPADMVLQMSEGERRKLAQRDQQLNLQGRSIDIRRAQLQLQKDKFDWAKAHPGAAGGRGGSTLTQNARAQAYRKVWEKGWADYDRLSQTLKTTTADFDPLKPDPKDSDQVALSRLYKAAVQAGDQYKQFLKTQGVDIDLNIGIDSPVIMPPPGKAGAPPGRPEAAPSGSARTGLPSKPASPADVRYDVTFGGRVYRSVTKREFRDNLIKAGAGPAEVNAILKQVWRAGGTSGGAQPGR